MKEPFQISAKALGMLAMPAFCPRCFWIGMHNRSPKPYQIFPGIFSSIDGYSKRVTALYFQHHLRLPKCLKAVGLDSSPLPVPHWTKFQFVDERTRVKLTGVPDEIFRLARRGNGLAILDYKTARYTETQDELLPIYHAQLNCYAVISERIGLGETRWAGLAYYEPV